LKVSDLDVFKVKAF